MITFRCTYHNRTFISLRGVFSSGSFGTSTIQCITSRARKALCHWFRYRPILTSNVSIKHLHQNAESMRTVKVRCCRELNKNSFYVSIQVDTTCVHSLLTAGWPKLPCKRKSQAKTTPSSFAFLLDIPKLSNFVDNAVLDFTVLHYH